MKINGKTMEYQDLYVPAVWADALFAGSLTKWDHWEENKIPLTEGEKNGLASFISWVKAGGWALRYESDDTFWGTSVWSPMEGTMMYISATRADKN